MRIRVGYEIAFDCPAPTPMVLMLAIHYTRAGDMLVADRMETDPPVATTSYRDGFGNWCIRLVAPAGRLRLSSHAVLRDSGLPDRQTQTLFQHPVPELPDDSLVFLLGSRYCETDRLANIAWDLFGNASTGVARIQAICDYVHSHVAFSYQDARSTRTACDALREGRGVCRDFAHLAIAFCRCLNIPARYCTGYLGDIGVRRPAEPMDFAAWFEAYIDGDWYTFDARNNQPRIGRVLIARGRDAADVPISNIFGTSTLSGFTVWADEVASDAAPA